MQPLHNITKYSDMFCFVHLQIFCNLLAGPRGKRHPTTTIFLGPGHYLVVKSWCQSVAVSTREIFYCPRNSSYKVEQRAKLIQSYALQWRLRIDFSVNALLDGGTLKCSEFRFHRAATSDFDVFMHRDACCFTLLLMMHSPQLIFVLSLLILCFFFLTPSIAHITHTCTKTHAHAQMFD